MVEMRRLDVLHVAPIKRSLNVLVHHFFITIYGYFKVDKPTTVGFLPQQATAYYNYLNKKIKDSQDVFYFFGGDAETCTPVLNA